jgi:hypothetical protein
MKRQNILVLYWYPSLKDMRSAIRHHLETLENSDIEHHIIYCNVFSGVPPWLKYLPMDVLILHTTLLCLRWTEYFSNLKWNLRWIKHIKCVKIAIPQDEYDHSEILDQWMYELNIPCILTNFNEEHRARLYPLMHDKAKFYKCLTGYINPEIAKKHQKDLSAHNARSNDIVYRATRLPYWFGSHGQLKCDIADIFSSAAKSCELNYDISTSPKDTIIGDQWFDFLGSSRTVIGCESGSSVLDRRGEIKAKIQWIMNQHHSISIQELDSLLPKSWDSYRFFAVSPRHFEAIITKTCQVLVEGNYDDILIKNKHYIPIKRDFSNLDEVINKIKDNKLVESIAESAYTDIYLNGKYTYFDFAKLIEDVISEFQGSDNIQYQNILSNNFLNYISWNTGVLFLFIREVIQDVSWQAGSYSIKFFYALAKICSLFKKLNPISNVYNSRFKIFAIFLCIKQVPKSKLVQSIIATYCKNNNIRNASNLNSFLKELLLISLVERFAKSLFDKYIKLRFKTLIFFDNQSKSVRFLCIPVSAQHATKSDINTNNQQSVELINWNNFESLFFSGEIKNLIWDNSQLGAILDYPLIGDKVLQLNIGETKILEFNIIQLIAKYDHL